MTGLFESRTGESRNIPILRAGMIAALPGEPVDATENGHGKFPAFLIEARSIPGMSGAPVFIGRPSESVNLESDHITTLLGGSRTLLGGGGGGSPIQSGSVRMQQGYTFDLLGVAYGHFRTPYRGRGARAKIHRINTGIALVVPRTAIWELVFSEEERMRRKKEKEKRDREDAGSISADRAMPSQSEFEKVLRRVSKRTKSEPRDS